MSRLYDFFKTGGQYEHAPMAHFQDQKPSGTHGGTSVSGNNTRILTNVVVNEIVGASLASNEITLPAGEYYIDARSPCYTGAASTACLTVQTSGSAILLKSPSYLYNVRGIDIAAGKVTLTATTTIKLVHTLGAATTSTGLGWATGVAPYEIYADVKIWQLDAIKTSPIIHNNKLYPVAGQGYVTGNVYGLEYSYTSANTITVEAGVCMDSLNTTALSASSSQVVTIGTTINEIYNLFLCDDGVVRTDTDVDGATLLAGTVTALRWIGFVKNDSSGNIMKFVFTGSVINFINSNILSLGSATTSWTLLGVSSVMPTSRISSIGFRGTSRFTFSYDGISESGGSEGTSTPLSAVTDNIYFKGASTSITVYLNRFTLKR